VNGDVVVWSVTLGEFADQLELHGFEVGELTESDIELLRAARAEDEVVSWMVFTAVARAVVVMRERRERALLAEVERVFDAREVDS
jgi:hypothetical protein